MRKSWFSSLIVFGSFGAAHLSVQVARADASTCQRDSDCSKGFSCMVELNLCVPASCLSDSDCASEMVCHWTSLPCPEHVPDCEPATIQQCTPKYDLPCHVAADCGAGFSCVMNQECTCPGGVGSGESGGAGGSSGTAGMGAGGTGGSTATPPPIDGDCTCAPSTTGSCQAVPMPCTA